ncbi:hypothetical protein EJ02DRAFT_488035 [Clathrospora elynae]|uniref:Uncharacterized protein n=1 Tax=Clathrospora elynae TaxID=706981 RepID=A0A6A5SSQ4_9PLEO|nr:hypothetical protein EJ02DRAFT_488035 [Clathrospora elynae]
MTLSAQRIGHISYSSKPRGKSLRVKVKYCAVAQGVCKDMAVARKAACVSQHRSLSLSLEEAYGGGSNNPLTHVQTHTIITYITYYT